MNKNRDLRDAGRIGVFDSGLGGLSVVARLLVEAPHLGVHYFADTAHVPYGERSPLEVRRLTGRIVEYLVEKGATSIVMACNTATALSWDEIQRWCPVPLVGIIQPATRAALMATRNGRIGVIASPLTAASGAYQAGGSGEVQVKVVGCPELVPLIEAGEIESPTTRNILENHLEPLRGFGIDALILGCSHFAFLRTVVSNFLGPQVYLIDPGAFVGAELRRHAITTCPNPTHLFEVSGDPEHFQKIGSGLLGRPLGPVGHVSLEQTGRIACGR